MKCDLKKKLLLLAFTLYLSLNVESAHKVNGTSEANITVEFTFQDSVVNSFLNLYKNENKKGSCRQTSSFCSERFVLSDVENSTVTLHITNLSLEDEGLYHLVVLADGQNPLIESNKIYIAVKLWNKTTENVLTPPHEGVVTNPPKQETSEQKSFIIFFSASLLVFICIFVGILCWFYRTNPRKPDAENPAVQNNRTTQQGQCGRSGAVVVSCVEYGELDFQNRPERDDRVKPAEATSKAQDGVEYAAIIFPQQKQTPSGRMRNKQQVPAIK
ncbi:uncharacterized protein LOC130093252 [Rhinichthys klamathensis goyatoka]|uniref:uncharacterized protein LOC130093252 n=1 Tax=Rhinichthys klamathensis goyatoka TaxID=3034132 RepID=UPI0024B5B46E|nr:uncharacterized protein LOC130093252 [Rhinichthys klamathensis goyatoka]